MLHGVNVSTVKNLKTAFIQCKIWLDKVTQTHVIFNLDTTDRSLIYTLEVKYKILYRTVNRVVAKISALKSREHLPHRLPI